MRASSPTSPCTVVSRRMRASTGGRSTRDRSTIVLEFLNPAGSVFGRLLPTGHLQDQIETTRGAFVISIVDVSCCRCWLRSGAVARCCSRWRRAPMSCAALTGGAADGDRVATPAWIRRHPVDGADSGDGAGHPFLCPDPRRLLPDLLLRCRAQRRRGESEEVLTNAGALPSRAYAGSVNGNLAFSMVVTRAEWSWSPPPASTRR
jgi:hypothetical protein